jgi:1-acyl-sn-glycerol-3-phosphate acyltransferase
MIEGLNANLTSPVTRDQLISAITSFLAGHGDPAPIRDMLSREIDAAGPGALERLGARLAAAGTDWDYYPPDPLARKLHQLLAQKFLKPDSTFRGAAHLAALAGKPVVILANHLSYSDANVLEVMLQLHGCGEVAERLTAIAGPKVYSSLTRRFSSLCFGTIKVAQSSGLSSEDAVMTPREVARAARRSIEHAHARLAAGDALLVFAEGTRSRSGGMQQMLAGVSRYLDVPGVTVCPIGIAGTEEFFPIGDTSVHAVTVHVSVGPPIAAAELDRQCGGDRQAMMDRAGRMIAAELPAAYRGVYAV